MFNKKVLNVILKCHVRVALTRKRYCTWAHNKKHIHTTLTTHTGYKQMQAFPMPVPLLLLCDCISGELLCCTVWEGQNSGFPPRTYFKFKKKKIRQNKMQEGLSYRNLRFLSFKSPLQEMSKWITGSSSLGPLSSTWFWARLCSDRPETL